MLRDPCPANASLRPHSPRRTAALSYSTHQTYLDETTDSGKSIERQFCGNCGSALMSLPSSSPDKAFVKVRLGIQPVSRRGRSAA